MIVDVVAVVVSIAVVASLSGALYAWFVVSLRRFDGVVAKGVLASWEAHLAQLPPSDREAASAQPPVEVLEATFALPSPRQFQSSRIP
jgi:hypothetical protein